MSVPRTYRQRCRDPSSAHTKAFDGRELCWVAPMTIAISSLPSGAPRPDDASKAQFVMAGLLARGALPLAAFPGHPSGIGEGSSLTVAGAAPAWRTLAPASLFTFHAEGPSRTTLAGASAGVNRAQAVLTSWRPLRQAGRREREPDIARFERILAADSTPRDI